MGLSFTMIFWVVLQGIVAFYMIKGVAWLMLALIYYGLRRPRPSITETLDEIWNRSMRQIALTEEIHAVITNQVSAKDLPKIRELMLREEGLKNNYSYSERDTWDGRHRIYHNQLSEIEHFLEHFGRHRINKYADAAKFLGECEDKTVAQAIDKEFWDFHGKLIGSKEVSHWRRYQYIETIDQMIKRVNEIRANQKLEGQN